MHMISPAAKLEEILTSMIAVDDAHRRKGAIQLGTAARVEVETKSMIEAITYGISQGMAKMEVFWAQKYAKAGSRDQQFQNRGAAACIMCYCCGDKGHYSRNCNKLQGAQCTFCNKQDHLAGGCKAKKDRESGGAVNNEVSFFMGSMAEKAECNAATLFSIDETGCEPSTIQRAYYFLCDSGASHHMCNDERKFKTMRPFTGSYKVRQIDGHVPVTILRS